VTAYPKETIRFHIHGTRLRKYLQTTKPHWTDEVWKKIDFQVIGMAIKNLAVTRRLQVSKLIHGWLPTGHKRTQVDTTARSNCPSCDEPNETQEHIITCRDRHMRAARYKGLMSLRSKIVTQKGGSHSWSALHESLVWWAETKTSPQPLRILRNVTNGRLHKVLTRAMHEQEGIGWHLAYRGYLSTSWVTAQWEEHPKSTEQGIRQQWMKTVVREIWNMTVELWGERNKILHSSAAGTQIRESATDSKVRHAYGVKDTFAHTDQVLFDIPLATRLTHPQRSKKQWLALVARYHPTTANRKKGNQSMITQFFTRQTGEGKQSRRLDSNTLEAPPNISTAENSESQLGSIPEQHDLQVT
jgi:hypothetical protein